MSIYCNRRGFGKRNYLIAKLKRVVDENVWVGSRNNARYTVRAKCRFLQLPIVMIRIDPITGSYHVYLEHSDCPKRPKSIKTIYSADDMPDLENFVSGLFGGSRARRRIH